MPIKRLITTSVRLKASFYMAIQDDCRHRFEFKLSDVTKMIRSESYPYGAGRTPAAFMEKDKIYSKYYDEVVDHRAETDFVFHECGLTTHIDMRAKCSI